MNRGRIGGKYHPRKRGALSKAVGLAIRQLRNEAGLTQERLAERMELYDGETVRKIELKGCSSVEAMSRYASALGTTTVEILRRAETMIR